MFPIDLAPGRFMIVFRTIWGQICNVELDKLGDGSISANDRKTVRFFEAKSQIYIERTMSLNFHKLI